MKLASWRSSSFLLLGALGVGGCVTYAPRPLDLNQSVEARAQRRLDDPALLEFLVKQQAAHPAGSTWSFEQLALAAFHFHPDLAAARASWQAEESAERTAGERPNPTLAVTPERVANPGAATPWSLGLSLDFPLETAGKRDLRVEAAKARSEAARLRLGTTVWEVRSRVRKAWLDLVDARQKARFLDRQRETLEQVQKTLAARLAAGGATSTEISTARINLTRNLVQAGDAQAAAEEARVRLAAAVALSPHNFPPLEQLALDTAPASDLATPEARRRALTARADLLAAVADLAAADAAFRLELARQYPDVHLGPGYQYDQGANKWSVGFGFDLPLFNRNEGAIGEARAKREAAAQTALALQERITGELDTALAAVHGARVRLDQVAGLKTSHETRLTALKAQFESGATEALDLLNARSEMATDALLIGEAETRLRRAQGDLEDVLQLPTGFDPAPPVLPPAAAPAPNATPVTAPGTAAAPEPGSFHSF